ncbi:carbohydrate ABC transporter permease [Massiliimalia massiliensis]|jgi:raffinose/stachyose/melibiose transport system permease protein|uniref:carbohydrate ABC transporter permease n=1 Tax=Massiliimalia massiliensis TaxID=1852384 RepID=UPI00098455D5|nr:sugar ABC transporter permease [Massiliimalia massiliensis]
MENGSSILYQIKFRKVLFYFLIPILLYLFIVILPLCTAFYYSLNMTTNFTLVWNGLDNYVKILSDDIFWLSLKNNIFIMIFAIITQLVPAFIIMVMISTGYVFKSKFVQSVFFFPCVISAIVVSYLWQIMYDNQTGVFNTLLRLVGLESLQQNWLADPKIVMTSICIPLAWQFIGYYLVILLSGMSAIDKEILEVAEIDGATGLKKSVYIILPLMKNTISVVMLLSVTGSIKIFDQVFAMTGGGPGYASNVLGMYSYIVSFKQANYGYGSAISISMLIISLLLIGVMSLIKKAVSRND